MNYQSNFHECQQFYGNTQDNSPAENTIEVEIVFFTSRNRRVHLTTYFIIFLF